MYTVYTLNIHVIYNSIYIYTYSIYIFCINMLYSHILYTYHIYISYIRLNWPNELHPALNQTLFGMHFFWGCPGHVINFIDLMALCLHAFLYLSTF